MPRTQPARVRADRPIVFEIVEPRPRTDRYVLLERIGRGGAAEVWRARHESAELDQEVCIKRTLRPLSPDDVRSLLEEARLLARVRHANVVSLLDVELDAKGTPFLVLELVRGLDVRALVAALRLRAAKLPPALAVEIGCAVARALAVAQRAVPGGLVHRDVSPSNVLVSSEGEIKLGDFGIARSREREAWTREGLVKGKIAYLSPEQLRGERLDVRSDLFSLGVVMFELLAGFKPFVGADTGAVMRAIAEGRRPSIADVCPWMTSSLAAAVEKLLARDPAERPPNADAALALLAPFARGADASMALRRLVAVARAPLHEASTGRAVDGALGANGAVSMAPMR